jgi:putative pyruvate formate lyase activating enzyme
MSRDPSYVDLVNAGQLEKRKEQLYEILESCKLCARKCAVNRMKGQIGFCRSDDKLKISSFGPHFGEEVELVGRGGSGTIFLTNCNLGCIYCQNFDISHLGRGTETTPENLANTLLYLQNIGCHNINFVTPSHFIPQIVDAVNQAAAKGLRLPLVFNCGGYENVDIIRMLDGIFDIYMPDIKYSDYRPAEKYSSAKDYFAVVREAVLEMYKQVGNLKLSDGIATRGLLVRHLVLPNDLAGSYKVLEFLASQISQDTYVNIMDQYRPVFRASEFEELNRRVTLSEFRDVLTMARGLGLHRGFRIL